jgi:hypothetical protein
LKQSRHFCDNINIFQCIEGVLLNDRSYDWLVLWNKSEEDTSL